MVPEDVGNVLNDLLTLIGSWRKHTAAYSLIGRMCSGTSSLRCANSLYPSVSCLAAAV